VNISTTSKQPRFAYIDALRGYAILLVIAVHSSQYFSDLPGPIKAMADQGARGVQLFFVASALTLCMSWKTRNDGLLPFYVRRLFRIAPMFWLAIVLFVALQGVGPRYYAPDGIGTRHIAMAALFLHGLMPDTITSVVPGSWSIADEMMFYSVFPLLFLVFSRVRLVYTLILTIAATFVCMRINRAANMYVVGLPEADRGLWATFVYLWFPQQFPCFLFGMLLYKVSMVGKPPSHRAVVACLLTASIAALVALPFMQSAAFISSLGLPTTYGIVFCAYAFCLMHWQPKVLVNPIIGWIGKVSYSAYFSHFALIQTAPMPFRLFSTSLVNYPLVFVSLTVCTIAVSSITYLLIEQPAIRLGNRLLRERTGRASMATPLTDPSAA